MAHEARHPKAGWVPEHPETAPHWLCWRILASPLQITMSDLSQMALHEMADALESLEVMDDVRRFYAAKANPKGATGG